MTVAPTALHPPWDWRTGYVVEVSGELARARVVSRPECPFCGDVGRRTVEIEGVERVVRCRCQKLPDRVALFNAARIPSRHAHSTMESFRRDLDGAEPGWAVARRWLDAVDARGSAAKGLVFEGAPGRGKTHLLCAIVRELVFRHGIPARHVEFSHLLAELKEAFGRGGQTSLTPLADVQVLAIDELGRGRGTDWEQSVADELVTRRYNAARIILGTTNFPSRGSGGGRSLATPTAETLQERLGERVMSRLRETVVFAPVIGEDYRVVHAGRPR